MPQNKQQQQHPKTTKIKISQSLQTISEIKEAHCQDPTSAGCCSSPTQQQTQQLQQRPLCYLMMAQVQQRHKQHNRNPHPCHKNKKQTQHPKTAQKSKSANLYKQYQKPKKLTVKTQRLQAAVLLQRSSKRSSSSIAHGVP
jgi:hypothetical protein